MGGPGSGFRTRTPKSREYATRLYSWIDGQMPNAGLDALRVLVRACDEGWQEFAAAVLDEAFSGTKSWDRAVLVRRLGEALQHVAGEYLHEAYEAAASPAARTGGDRGE